MTAGLRAKVRIGDPAGCPVATTTEETETQITDVSRASKADPDGQVVEEFTLDAACEPTDPELSEVASFSNQSVYRFSRDREDDCVCDAIEQFGFPVSNVHARDGNLYVSFHAPDLSEVGSIIETLQARFDGVQLRTLTKSIDDTASDLVLVDRHRLTDRQQEVLETAFEMGYFDYPKGANAGDVAEAIGISTSTFSEHLSAAQRKVLDGVVGEDA